MKSRQYRFIYFKDYLPQILLSPFLNFLSHLLVADNCRNFIQNFKLYQTSKVVTYNKNVIQNFNLYQTSKIVTYNKNFRYDFKTICFYFILFYFYCIKFSPCLQICNSKNVYPRSIIRFVIWHFTFILFTANRYVLTSGLALD